MAKWMPGGIPLLAPDGKLGRHLPVQDELNPEESGNGYVLRLARANGMSFGHVMLLMASPGHCYLPSSAVGHAAYMFGADTYKLHRTVPARFRDAGQMRVLFMGHVFSRTYMVRSARPQMCPRCLGEMGYAKAFWELSLATVCANHRVRLVDMCPHCGRTLSWRRPSLTQCWCGADLRDVTSGLTSDAEIEFNQLLEAKMSGFDLKPRLELHRMLASLGMNTLMRLMWSAGIQQVMPKGKAVPGKVTRIPDSALAGKIVRVALARLDPDGRVSCPPEQALWNDGDFVSDLAVDERKVLEQFSPGLLGDRNLRTADAGQLSLFSQGLES